MLSFSDWLNARGYPCIKGFHSSASLWLSGEQVRLCSGHPKVHFGTIVVGSWGDGGGGGVGGGEGALGDLLAHALHDMLHSERSTKPSARSGNHV